jgi:predicted Zn finger-like uncharacterized protein
MDVTCERCGTEYEFDETLLSGRGTSVKCTNCGHVFRVYPAGAADADRTTSTWHLRLQSGATDAIDSLRELQRRISSGELTPDDEIARGDESWKSLGSIPELETFFREAGFDVTSDRTPSPLPPVMPPPEKSESSLPPGKRPRQATLLGVSSVARPPGVPDVPTAIDAPAPPVTEPDPAAPSVLESSYESPYTRDSMPNADIEDAEFEEMRPRTLAVRANMPPPAYYEEDDDIPELPSRGPSPLKWLLIIVVVGAIALIATQWDRVAQLAGFGSDPALVAEAVGEGDAAIAAGHADAYAAAIDAYGRAIEAGATSDSRVFAKLSNAYALAAQARLDDDPNADVAQLTSAAIISAESATKLDRLGVQEQLAYVDALRLADSNAEARERLEEVRTVSFSRTAEFFRVDARLSAAEAGGSLQNGLRSARQAAEMSPDGVRYLLLAARAELAAENDERAKERLTEILALEPEHPTATLLLASLEASEDEAAEEPAAADATEELTEPADAPEEPAEPEASDAAEPEEPEPPAEAAAPPVPSPAEEAKPEPPAPPPEEEPAATPKAERRKPELDEYDQLRKAAGSDAFVDGRPPVIDYESNMTKGREELAAGNYARARAYFDSALEVHPGSADAMDALGDVATAVSDYSSALRYYRVAAQRGRMDGYFKLGKTYEKLGKTEEAVSAYYTYIKRRPRGPHAAEARNAITTLEPRAKLPPEPEPTTPQETTSP